MLYFHLLDFQKKSPEDTGTALGEYIVENCKDVIAFQVVKGFLNLSISDELLGSSELGCSGMLGAGFGLQPEGL